MATPTPVPVALVLSGEWNDVYTHLRRIQGLAARHGRPEEARLADKVLADVRPHIEKLSRESGIPRPMWPGEEVTPTLRSED